MSAESNKSLGGIGALLIAFAFVPILPLVGLILVLISLKGLSEHYNDNEIYQNAMMGVIFGIIGFVCLAALIVGALALNMFSAMTVDFMGFIGSLGLLLAAIVVAFVFFILFALYFRKSLDALASKSGEKMFSTAGLLFFLGAILTIIGVGLILMFIAAILMAVAFFSMKVTAAPSPPPPPPQ